MMIIDNNDDDDDDVLFLTASHIYFYFLFSFFFQLRERKGSSLQRFAKGQKEMKRKPHLTMELVEPYVIFVHPQSKSY